jgi:peptidoglycan/xylan/chitin deacetylase (PgdA/CDA1 family)
VAALKRTAKRLLVAGGATELLRLYRRRDTLVLAYHNIVPDGVPLFGEVGLHMPRAQFAEQLDILARTCDVVPLRDVTRERAGGKPRVAITFDDAYRGAVTLGAAELAARGLPATVFVPPHFLGRSFWWDAIEWPGGMGSGGPLRERAFSELGARDELVRRAALESGLSVGEPPDYALCASEDDLRRALAMAPLSLGSHSWSHPSLPALGAAELREELERPLHWLLERFERVEPTLAYPYGQFSDAVARAAREVGYKSAVRVGGGWIRKVAADPYRLPRLHVPLSLSADGFTLATAGLVRE